MLCFILLHTQFLSIFMPILVFLREINFTSSTSYHSNYNVGGKQPNEKVDEGNCPLTLAWLLHVGIAVLLIAGMVFTLTAVVAAPLIFLEVLFFVKPTCLGIVCFCWFFPGRWVPLRVIALITGPILLRESLRSTLIVLLTDFRVWQDIVSNCDLLK